MFVITFLLFLTLWLHVIKGQTVNIKIGAICTENTDPQVLQLALYDILQSNIIIPQIAFGFEFRNGCKDGTGLDFVSELHYSHNVSALIGPNCSEDIDCVSKLVTIWKLPVITYAASVKSEKRASPVSRIAPTTANTLCDSIITIMKELNLDKTVLFYNAGDTNVVSQALYLIKLLNNNNIQSRNFELQSTNITWYEFNGMVNIEDVQQFTRVIILLMGDSLDENVIVLQHLRKAGITASDYVIFLPWINEDPDKSYPWLENTISPVNYTKTVTVNDITKKDFIGCYVIDSDNNGTTTTTRFSNLLINNSMEFSQQNRNKLSRAFVLYDSLKLLVIAVNQSYTKMGFLGRFNSSLMLQQISGITFEGASGVVEMDFNNERIPFYSLYEIRENSDFNIYQIAKISPVKYITENNQTTYYLKMSGLDPALKDKLKSKTAEPACGFQGYKCDYSKWYVISGTITVIVIVIGIGYYLKKRGGFRRVFTSNKTVAQLSWHIPIEKVEMIKDESPRNLSQKSESELSAASGFIRHVGITNETAIVYNNIVKIRRFKQLKNINFDQTEAQFLLSLKQLVHDNINPIIGLCYNNPTNELLVLSKFCSRGTLSEYLHNPEMRMDGKFKTAFLRDIINGLDYLHNAPIGYHGNLTTSNCVIDANFIVKLVSVGMEDLLEDWKDNNLIEDIEETTSKTDIRPINEHPDEELLFRAPEFLRKAPPIRPKLIRMSKNEQIRIKLMCRMADIYSMGILFFEVLFRQHPYADVQTPVEGKEGITVGVIVNKIRTPTRQLLRPTLPKVIEKEHHPAMIQLMQACWSEDPISRPPIKRVKKLFSTVYKVRGGLVDSIIQMMDQHANSLEKQVRERTRLLEEAQLRADRLLAQMIPKDVARDLKLGRPVIPRGFDSSSVLFTDIVSFTTICSKSSPMEIVNFLNDLFTGYDAIISQTDAYKVETIGDAYLVVSGVPNENGTENVKVIATIALQMRQYLSQYKLPHIPDFKMEARWGLHSGPVAAGVVGLIAPRYCLFGDTVNMASRMESTSEPTKIQTSLEFHAALTSRKDPFVTEKRGTITVKGKGECLTYWLVRAADDAQPQNA